MKKLNVVVGGWKGFAREHQHGFLWDLEWTKLNDALGGDFHREYLLLQVSWSECDDIFVGVWRAECQIYQASTRECSPLLQSCARAMMWQVATSGYAKVWLSSLAFDTRLASGLGQAHPKYVFVRYRDLAYVTRPHEWRIIVAQWRKSLNRVKNDLSIEWEWYSHVQLVWILTTKHKSFVESGQK